MRSSVLFVFSPAYSWTSQPVLCEWRWLVGVYMWAPGLKTWPGFKDIHQRTDASGFRVCCYTDSYSFTPFHSTVVYFKMDWAADNFFLPITALDSPPDLTLWHTASNAASVDLWTHQWLNFKPQSMMENSSHVILIWLSFLDILSALSAQTYKLMLLLWSTLWRRRGRGAGQRGRGGKNSITQWWWGQMLSVIRSWVIQWV